MILVIKKYLIESEMTDYYYYYYYFLNTQKYKCTQKNNLVTVTRVNAIHYFHPCRYDLSNFTGYIIHLANSENATVTLLNLT